MSCQLEKYNVQYPYAHDDGKWTNGIRTRIDSYVPYGEAPAFIHAFIQC